MPATAPDQPELWQAIQEDIESKILPGVTHWNTPNFMAFFPALVTYPSILGEIYSAAFNAPAFNWLCSPACTELETVVMDWVARALGLWECFMSTSPGGGGGVIHGSASEAIVTVLVAARERTARLIADEEGLKEGSSEREDRICSLRGKMVALSSDQAHSSTQKGALIAGIRYRSIPTSFSEDLSLTAHRLGVALEECTSQGLVPCYLTLAFGATGTCAVDDLAGIAELRKLYPKLWIHIDAAYAGAALVLPEFQKLYAEDIARVADSFNFNMHKWLLVNFDASCLFVQNRNDLTRALSVTPSYLQNSFTDSGLVTDYRDWQIPLGRRFRALKIWIVMRTYGIEGMQKHIQNSLAVGEAFTKMVLDRNDLFEIVAPPKFALTCLRIRPQAIANARSAHRLNKVNLSNGSDASSLPNGNLPDRENTETFFGEHDTKPPPLPGQNGPSQDLEALANSFTLKVAERINAENEIFITPTTTAGKTFIRVVSGNPNASVEYAEKAMKIIERIARDVLGEGPERA